MFSFGRLRYNAFMKGTTFTAQDVTKTASLANIPVTDTEKKELAEGFTTTIKVVDELFKVSVKNVEPTHQVTGRENVFREDTVDAPRMLSQDAALSNAPRTHNGYFVVDRVIVEES
jgi:aspartyl/glutamyl-tRNA(Asn/Gln) amidotransferase C subunit